MTDASKLEGAALDAAVSRAMGLETEIRGRFAISDGIESPFRPSTDWQQGGPIIERESIAIVPMQTTGPVWWEATPAIDKWPDESVGCATSFAGPTPLIAAMRAFCASRAPVVGAPR